jgi:hypothetical protein
MSLTVCRDSQEDEFTNGGRILAVDYAIDVGTDQLAELLISHDSPYPGVASA